MQSTCCCRNDFDKACYSNRQPVSEVHASLVLEAWQWHEFYAMLWFVVQLEMLADDETLHAYSGLPPWQKGHWFNFYKVYSNSLTQWNVANRKFQLVSNEKLESKRQKSGHAVTRIRTWVVTATTWSTNHYTITARNPAALAAIFKHNYDAGKQCLEKPFFCLIFSTTVLVCFF